MRSAIIGILAGLCAAACQGAAAQPAVAPQVVSVAPYPPAEASFKGGVTGLPSVTYAQRVGYRPLTLDLYLPPAEARAKGPLPLVIWVHGGGWAMGTPRLAGAFEDWPSVLASVAARGYVVAGVSFRFFREAPYPAALDDVRSAVRWLRANADSYGIDKNRVVLWGASSGAQLAAGAALACGDRTLATRDTSNAGMSDCVQGLVGWYGVYDFDLLTRDRPDPSPGVPEPEENPFLGCAARICTSEELRAASPVTYADAADPPVLLIHGDADRDAPLGQSAALRDALSRAGSDVELVIAPGVGHAWIGATPEQTRGAALGALDRTLAFFDRIVHAP